MVVRRAIAPVMLALALASTGFGAAIAQGDAAKPAPVGPAEADLIGIWQFETPLCQSGYGMGLFADGTAWLDEIYGGTWRLADGRLRFDVDETEMGVDEPVATGIVIVADIVNYETDVMLLRWADTGQEIEAYRCPAP